MEGRSHSIFDYDEKEIRMRRREKEGGREKANGLHVEMELLIRFRCKGLESQVV